MARSPLTLAASVTSALPQVGVVGVGALTEGATGRFAWTGEVVLAARFLAVEPQTRVAFSWAEGILSDRASVVDIELQDAPGGTQVHLVESGFPLDGDDASKREALRALAAGWTVELDELVDLAEDLGA